jgi:Protein of unknown function (DUF938)
MTRDLYDEGAWRKPGQSQVECARKMTDHRQYAPATVRNRDFILDVLRDVLPTTGVILEIASGSGEHVVHFASNFPSLVFQPSDPEPEALLSVAAWVKAAQVTNVRAPIVLDASQSPWPIASADRRREIRCGARRLIFLLLACLFAGPALAADADWTGSWDTHWRDGGAGMDLTQNGSHVTGAYPLYGGQIVAEAKGRTLQGNWIEGRRKGGFLFVMASDDKSFMGRFDTGEWWTGGRIPAGRPTLPIDQTGVRETLRTFVQGGNFAHAGLLDQLAAAAAVLDFGDR